MSEGAKSGVMLQAAHPRQQQSQFFPHHRLGLMNWVDSILRDIARQQEGLPTEQEEPKLPCHLICHLHSMTLVSAWHCNTLSYFFCAFQHQAEHALIDRVSGIAGWHKQLLLARVVAAIDFFQV